MSNQGNSFPAPLPAGEQKNKCLKVYSLNHLKPYVEIHLVPGIKNGVKCVRNTDSTCIQVAKLPTQLVFPRARAGPFSLQNAGRYRYNQAKNELHFEEAVESDEGSSSAQTRDLASVSLQPEQSRASSASLPMAESLSASPTNALSVTDENPSIAQPAPVKYMRFSSPSEVEFLLDRPTQDMSTDPRDVSDRLEWEERAMIAFFDVADIPIHNILRQNDIKLDHVEQFNIDLGQSLVIKVRKDDGTKHNVMSDLQISADQIVKMHELSSTGHRIENGNSSIEVKLSQFTKENRAVIEYKRKDDNAWQPTLHRVCRKVYHNHVHALTIRFGREAYGCSRILRDRLNSHGRNILLLGSPGVGKTTLLRDAARYLSETLQDKTVHIIDTSSEICGSTMQIHSSLIKVRRTIVENRAKQHEYLIEEVQNHGPDVIILDELANAQEAKNAATTASKGVRIIATAHGEKLSELTNNKDLLSLLGGLAPVAMSDITARSMAASKGNTKGIEGNKVQRIQEKASPIDEVVVFQGYNDLIVFDINAAGQSASTSPLLHNFLQGNPISASHRWKDNDGYWRIQEGQFHEDEFKPIPISDRMRPAGSTQ